jgi:hypothetical protein
MTGCGGKAARFPAEHQMVAVVRETEAHSPAEKLARSSAGVGERIAALDWTAIEQALWDEGSRRPRRSRRDGAPTATSHARSLRPAS